MEGCCRTCLPCLDRLWSRLWPQPRAPDRAPDRAQQNRAPVPAQNPAQAQVQAPAPRARPVQLYAALFDFEARSQAELSVLQGDRLSVLEARGGFVLARKLGGSLQAGLVPANYVALLQDEFAKHK